MANGFGEQLVGNLETPFKMSESLSIKTAGQVRTGTTFIASLKLHGSRPTDIEIIS